MKTPKPPKQPVAYGLLGAMRGHTAVWAHRSGALLAGCRVGDQQARGRRSAAPAVATIAPARIPTCGPDPAKVSK
jgi:hypothetical protein